MSSTLALTALLMGLAGGPHCVAMCGAACAGLTRAARGGVQPAQQPVRFQRGALAGVGPVPSPVADPTNAASDLPFVLLFQLGRVLGYAALGGLAAASMQGLGWLTVHSAALRPLWSLLHVAAIALGLVLLLRAVQPAWLEQGAQALWRRVQRLMQRRSTVGDASRGYAGAGGRTLVVFGALWALLPCGLLYSALLVATLTGQVWQGAAVMALFALGTAVSMTLGPWLWLRLGQGGALRHPLLQNLGVRLAGLALVLSSAWALWMGLAHDTAPWCLTV